MLFKPMLAGTLAAPFIVGPARFPLYVSRKLDGVRATIQDGRVYSRSLKLHPNKFTQAVFGSAALEGLDGELILGPPNAPDVFRKSAAAVSTITGHPALTYWVFDVYDPKLGYADRFAKATAIVKAYQGPADIRMVDHQQIADAMTLTLYENRWVAEGYEGLMIRSLTGRYKQGRSTVNEGALLKLKRFVDGEGVVTGFVEQMQNGNVATINALGHTARSSHKQNKTSTGMVGAFWVKNCETGVAHKVNTGPLTEHTCRLMWLAQAEYLGRIVKFRFQPTGIKDKPRFSQFVGWRAPEDMGEAA